MTATEAPSRDSAKTVLRTPVFRTLTVGWMLTNFADSLLTLIFAVWVADLTGSAALGGATFAALGVPALVSPFLGHLADRVSRRAMLTITYAIGAAILVPLYLVRDANDVWIIYTVTVLYSTVSYVTAACQAGILKDLVPDEALGRANSRFQTIDQVFRLTLPFVGAAVYWRTGMTPLITAAILAFVGASAIFGNVRLHYTPAPVTRGEGYFARATAGFRQLFRARPLRGMTWAMLFAVGITGLLNAAVFAVLDALGIRAVLLGPVTVFQGLTGVIGAILAPRLMERFGRVRVVAGGLTLLGLGVIPLMFTAVPVAVAGVAIVGFATTPAVIAFVTERQVATPADLQGRTSTASHLVLNLPQVLVTLLGSAALAILGYRILLALTAVVCLITGFACFRLRTQPAEASVPSGG
ncbi:MAG TPA: MFS transporter [Micromonosporaceae bacterium]|jgi:MFS family permease